jgi:ATP-dependent Clp protease ATP-binding subunit ClpA
MMFDRFNYRARRVVYAAVVEARERRATSLEPEHLALGLLHDDVGVARFFPPPAAEAARAAIEACCGGPGKGSGSGDLPLSRHLRRVFKAAVKSADEMQHTYAGPEHVLLVLLEEKIPVAARLRDTGVSAETVRSAIAGEGEVFRSLGESFPPPF